MRRWLASKLWPEFERTDRRFWYLWHQVDDVRKWCDGEARATAQWLVDADANYSRPLGTPAVGEMPSRIDGFREWIYKRRERVA